MMKKIYQGGCYRNFIIFMHWLLGKTLVLLTQNRSEEFHPKKHIYVKKIICVVHKICSALDKNQV